MRTSDHKSPTRRLADDEGQAIVEAAIVLPAMIFLVLVLLQLTMIQHARIMTDYAAFCAARAGIVYNADKAAMERAATTALFPTIGRSDRIQDLLVTEVKARLETQQRRMYGLPLVRVDVLNPKQSVFDQNLTGHLNMRELDFDDIRPAAAAANVLQIELTYPYRMTVPFANKILQTVFFAQRTGLLRAWRGADMTQTPLVTTVGARARFRGTGGEAGGIVAAATVADFDPTGLAGGYFFPLKTTYSMRMQSNVFRANAGQ